MYELAGGAATVVLAGVALFGAASWYCWKASHANRDTEYNDALSGIHKRAWHELYPRIVSMLGPGLSEQFAESVRRSPFFDAVLEGLTIGPPERIASKLDNAFRDRLIEVLKTELKRTAHSDPGATPDFAEAYGALQRTVVPHVEEELRLRRYLARAQRSLRVAAYAFLIPIPAVAYIAGAIVYLPWRDRIDVAFLAGGVAALPAVLCACGGLRSLGRFNDMRQQWVIDGGDDAA